MNRWLKGHAWKRPLHLSDHKPCLYKWLFLFSLSFHCFRCGDRPGNALVWGQGDGDEWERGKSAEELELGLEPFEGDRAVESDLRNAPGTQSSFAHKIQFTPFAELTPCNPGNV